MTPRPWIAAAAAAAVLAACSKEEPPRPPVNHAPQIDSLSALPFPVMIGDTVAVSADASDVDGDTLSFTFDSSHGVWLTPDGPTSRWIAPDSASACTLTVVVSDGLDAAEADTVVAVRDTAPLLLTITDVFAESGGDTMRAAASAPPDTLPMPWTFHARWVAVSDAAVARIVATWRGVSAEMPGAAREFSAPLEFSGQEALTLRAYGPSGEIGVPTSFGFVANFSPNAAFLRGDGGRRVFTAEGLPFVEGDTLLRRSRGWDIETCSTARDRDGIVTGFQFHVDAYGGTWTPILTDSCLEVRDLGDGNFSIHVRAIDGAGRVGPVDRLRFYINKSPRFVTADTTEDFRQRPSPGDTLLFGDANPLRIRFWAVDPEDELSWYRYRLDSHPLSSFIEPAPGPAPGLPKGALSTTLPYQIGSGRHTLAVTAADGTNRETTVTTTFFVIR